MLITLAAANDFGACYDAMAALPLGIGAVGLAVCTRQPVVTADILTDPRFTLPAAVRASLELNPCARGAGPALLRTAG